MTPDQLARFWPKVDKGGPDDCWTWTASIGSHGYGQLHVDGAPRLAHRLSYEHFIGPIAADMVIDHLCRNTACVNPVHLEVVDQRENLRRQAEARTRCSNGHPFSGENLSFDANGWRVCLACRRARISALTDKRRQQRRSVAA